MQCAEMVQKHNGRHILEQKSFTAVGGLVGDYFAVSEASLKR